MNNIICRVELLWKTAFLCKMNWSPNEYLSSTNNGDMFGTGYKLNQEITKEACFHS